MSPFLPGSRRLGLRALASGLGAWIISLTPGIADDGGPPGVGACPKCQAPGGCRQAGKVPVYGGPVPFQGFQGFGLGYHPGYGYGGDARGVGADGGYPFYGGPGYPHPAPCLRRFGGITPFPYYGGPGYPSPGHPNVFGGVGPLVVEQPVVRVEGDLYNPGPSGDYGPFTGAIPYPESTFAPFESGTSADGASDGVRPPPPALPR